MSEKTLFTKEQVPKPISRFEEAIYRGVEAPPRNVPKHTLVSPSESIPFPEGLPIQEVSADIPVYYERTRIMEEPQNLATTGEMMAAGTIALIGGGLLAAGVIGKLARNYFRNKDPIIEEEEEKKE